MPNHVHLLIEGRALSSDCKAFIKGAKQYSGYYFSKRRRRTLWQRYCYERVLRDEFERSMTIRYILDNPVCAGLVTTPSEYPFLGSDRYSIEELMQQAAYVTSA